MNDFMSLGIHRLWKHFSVLLAQVKPGYSVLDLAGGSGDLTRLMRDRLKGQGEIVLADINQAMMEVGRDRLLDEGKAANVHFVQANAEVLPFPDNHFHVITMAFGLRNVTDKERALREMFRVLKFGGKLMVLEFSTPTLPGLQTVYDWYSFQVLPKLGEFIADDAASYKYLAESIRKHPNQDGLKKMITDAGFEDCTYYNVSGGIVALHTAYKY
jgi:demethylmenaquinone methyltransferase/2-methoxy-6-polyprenyl-1,4-benzoquinol methylase